MFNCWTKSNSIHELSSVEFNMKCSFDFVHLTTLGIFVHDKCHWGGGLLSDYCPVAYFRWPTLPRKGFMMNTRRNLTLKGLNQKMNNHHKTANSRCVYFIWHFWFGFSWYEASSTSVWYLHLLLNVPLPTTKFANYIHYGVHHITHYWIDSLSIIQQMWPFLNLQTSIKTLCITIYFFIQGTKSLTKSLAYTLWNCLDHVYCCDVQFVWVIFLGSQIILLKQI